MADVSASLPKKLSTDISRSLGAAVRQTGTMDVGFQRRLKTAIDGLERTLKHYDAVGQKAQASKPLRNQLEEVIQDRVPSGYRDKAYKRLFWRTVHRVVPYLRQKKKTEDEINALTRLALSSFAVVFRSLVAFSNAFLAQSAPEGSSPEGLENGDPEEFDPELDEAISGIEREIKPSPGRDQTQRKTDQNVKNQQRRKAPQGAVADLEAFRAYTGQHEGLVDAARVSVSRYSDQLTKCLQFANQDAFSLVQASTTKAVELAHVLNSVCSASRGGLQPGTFIAAKSIMSLIVTMNSIVIQSAALNKSQRAEINKNLRKLQEGSQEPTVSAEEVL